MASLASPAPLQVILGVLILLFVLPVFHVDGYYGHTPTLEAGGLTMLHAMYGAGGDTVAFQDVVDVRGGRWKAGWWAVAATVLSNWIISGQRRLNPDLTSTLPLTSTLCCPAPPPSAMQTYVGDNSYRLGTRRTATLIRLTVYNRTLFDLPGGAQGLRADEVTSAHAQTPGCEGGLPTQCFYSKATFDTRWRNQLEVRQGAGAGRMPMRGQGSRAAALLAALCSGGHELPRGALPALLQPDALANCHCCRPPLRRASTPARPPQAILDMASTTFIIAILLVGSLLFIRDADRLVLKPLERMVKKVRRGLLTLEVSHRRP